MAVSVPTRSRRPPAGRLVEFADAILWLSTLGTKDRRAQRAVGRLREQLDAERGETHDDVRAPIAVDVTDVDGPGAVR